MPRWTVEAREQQRQLIRQWKPWERSTGPITPQGKFRSSRNACLKPGSPRADLRAVLSEMKLVLRALRRSR
jgi:hypothetical protein